MVKDTSPEFGAIIQSIGDCLKLGRHNVLGKEDVDTTATEIAADVELYVTVEMEGVEEAARLEGVPAITDVAQTAVAEEATGGQIAPSGSITTLALLATKDEDLHHPSLDEGGGQDHARPKSLVVLNTSNMLPSEPASETPHLDQSTRQARGGCCFACCVCLRVPAALHDVACRLRISFCFVCSGWRARVNSVNQTIWAGCLLVAADEHLLAPIPTGVPQSLREQVSTVGRCRALHHPRCSGVLGRAGEGSGGNARAAE